MLPRWFKIVDLAEEVEEFSQPIHQIWTCKVFTGQKGYGNCSGVESTIFASYSSGLEAEVWSEFHAIISVRQKSKH